MKRKVRLLLAAIVAILSVTAVTVGVVMLVAHVAGRLYGRPVAPVAVGLILLAYFTSLVIILSSLRMLFNKNTLLPAMELDRLEKERNLLAEQLNQSRKMAAIGHLAGDITHDFNNILTVIDGYAGLIAADPHSPDTARNAEQIVRSARRALEITRRLLGFQRREPRGRRCIEINHAVEEIRPILLRLLDDRFQLEIHPSETPLPVPLTQAQLALLLSNLVLNAREAMPNGGRITLEISEVKPEERVPGAENGFARLAVQDNGEGISPENIERIFEPFFSTREDGAGLGLTIVRSIVEKAGGTVDVVSRPGCGAVFLLYLPLVPACAGKTEATESSIPGSGTDAASPVAENVLGSRKKKRRQAAATILLVDDDEMIRSLIRETLSAYPYRLLVADNASQALRLAKKEDGPIDLLFTDVALQGMSGLELAQALRKNHPEMRVLFMSGYSARRSAEDLPEKAAFIEKPFTPDKVVETVNHLLARQLELW